MFSKSPDAPGYKDIKVILACKVTPDSQEELLVELQFLLRKLAAAKDALHKF